ncbi:unnamed protein product, partial [marine sediment metagenome]
DIIGDVRGLGLLIGIELVKDRKTKEPASKETLRMGPEALKRGLQIAAGLGAHNNIIRLTPPLIVTKDEADVAINIIEACLKQVT